MSWLEDFSDGEAAWQRLIATPTFGEFVEQSRMLSDYERDKIVLYHAIREKQQRGEWVNWSGGSAD